MLKNEMESYIRIGGERFEKSYVTLHGGEGFKNCQNRPYVINEWLLTSSLHKNMSGTTRRARAECNYLLVSQEVPISTSAPNPWVPCSGCLN